MIFEGKGKCSVVSPPGPADRLEQRPSGGTAGAVASFKVTRAGGSDLSRAEAGGGGGGREPQCSASAARRRVAVWTVTASGA